jgi:hypothetical protein
MSCSFLKCCSLFSLNIFFTFLLIFSFFFLNFIFFFFARKWERKTISDAFVIHCANAVSTTTTGYRCVCDDCVRKRREEDIEARDGEEKNAGQHDIQDPRLQYDCVHADCETDGDGAEKENESDEATCGGCEDDSMVSWQEGHDVLDGRAKGNESVGYRGEEGCGDEVTNDGLAKKDIRASDHVHGNQMAEFANESSQNEQKSIPERLLYIPQRIRELHKACKPAS